MEEAFDFQIDFENIPHTTAILANQEPQEDDLYEEIMQGSKKAYLCTFRGCGKVFKFKSEITRHVIIHQEDRPYCCTHGQCSKCFKRTDALETHMRIHAGILPFPCEMAGCDRAFATKAALKYHQIKHENNRVFRCDFPGCDKSFLTQAQLKQHLKAFNYHSDSPSMKMMEEEPIKMVKSEPRGYNGFTEEYTQPPTMSPSENSAGWDSKYQASPQITQVTQMTEIEQAPEKFQLLFKQILNENKKLKEKLEECKTMTDSYEKKLNCGLQSDNQTQFDFLQTTEPSTFFDSNELKFLEFLKE